MHDLLDQAAEALHRPTSQRDRQHRFVGAQKSSFVSFLLFPSPQKKKPESVLSLRKIALFSGMLRLGKFIFLGAKGKGSGVKLERCIGR